MNVKVDLSFGTWKVSEARAFRAAVGVNAEYAALRLDEAFRSAQTEARETFGESVDEPGWAPPDEWIPPSFVNLDPGYLLGFAWVAERRDEPDLSLDQFADRLAYQDLLDGFWTAVKEAAETVVPLVREEAEQSGPPSATASPSATSTAGRSRKSTASRSKSSAKRRSTSTTTQGR